jgi:annexin A7/11
MSRAADDLRAAMKGFGTDELTLIRVLAPMGPLEIASVKAAYQGRHRRDLIKDVHGETSNHLRETLEAVLRGPLDQDCHTLHSAVKGLGTKESAMNEVLLARSNADMHAIKARYQQLYGRSLEADVRGDLSMKTERLFDMVMAARRAEDTAPVLPHDTDRDVRDLYAATEARAGADQMTVCAILTARSAGQLRAVAAAYRARYQRPLAEVLRKEFAGHMEDALLHILAAAEDPAAHDAHLMEAAMKGLGTKDAALLRRVVVVHWDRDRLGQCKGAYRHHYGRDLVQRVRDETSGDYQKLLVACLGERV